MCLYYFFFLSKDVLFCSLFCIWTNYVLYIIFLSIIVYFFLFLFLILIPLIWNHSLFCFFIFYVIFICDLVDLILLLFVSILLKFHWHWSQSFIICMFFSSTNIIWEKTNVFRINNNQLSMRYSPFRSWSTKSSCVELIHKQTIQRQ